MQDYRVELDVYHGPLDLLLYLIRRDEIDIHNIPIAHIAEQYVQHVRTLRQLDIELAGEFLVMAATLMQIKSAMISPPPAAGEGESPADQAASALDDPADPRYELVQQLLAYKRFKDAAHALEARQTEFASRFPRVPARFERQADDDQAPPPLDLDDVSVWDLLEAFSRLMEQVGAGIRQHEIVSDDTPIELHAADILDRLQRDGAMPLQKMFEGRRTIGEMIGLFLALLELLRQRKVAATQNELAGEIHIEIRPEDQWLNLAHEEPSPKLEYDPARPENFAWPDEQTQRRYARRIERRARGEVIIEDQELDEDIAAIEKQSGAEIIVPGPQPPADGAQTLESRPADTQSES